MTQPPFTSVIVPVFDDRAALECCLTALEAQTYDASRYEIVVVDNGAVATLGDVAARFPHVRMAHEPRPGSYAARNTGLDRAVGDVLAFTDSDCVPRADWLQAAVARLHCSGTAAVVAGRIERAWRGARPTLAELYDSAFFLQQELYVRAGGFGITANLICRRQAFEQVGPFDRELKSGGDKDWGRRASARGLVIHYAPEVVVSHPTIHTVQGVIRKSRRVVGGHVQRVAHRRRFGRQPVRDLTRELQVIGARWRHFCERAPEAGRWDRLKMVGLIALVQAARALEHARLMLGGAPKRR